MKIKKTIIIAVLLMVSMLLCACSSSALDGHWVLQGEKSAIGINDMVLRSDGTGSVYGFPVNWSHTNNEIKFTLITTSTYNYMYSGGILTMYDSNGSSVKLMK